MRFKSVIGAFLFIVVSCIAAILVFLQSNSFGSLLTRIATDLSDKKIQTQLELRNISLSVFPPGLELNRIKIKKKISDFEEIDAELGKIGFYISLIEFEEKKLTFGEIRVADSYISYKFPIKNEEIKSIDRSIINKIFDFSENPFIQIDTILIENTKVSPNFEMLEIKRLKLSKNEKSITARFHLGNIRPDSTNDISVDEIWGDLDVTRDSVLIHRLKVQHDVHTILLRGRVDDYYKIKSADAVLNGELQIHLKNLNQDINMPKFLDVKGGDVKANFSLVYKNQTLSGTSEIIAEKIKSNLFYADEIKTLVEVKNKSLFVNKFDLKYKDQGLILRSPVEIYSFKNNSYLPKPVFASVNNVSLTNALRYFGSTLKPLRANLTGNIRLDYKNKDITFVPEDNFEVQNLRLVVGENKKTFKILSIKKAVLKNATFAVKNNTFEMDGVFTLQRSLLRVKGFVNSKKVKFHVPMAQINLEDFGNIANLDIKGAGQLSVDVSGPINNTIITLSGKTKGFEILKYRLDQTEKEISIELADSNVTIHKMESLVGKTNLSGRGTVNYGNSEIALGINSNDATFNDLTQILHPIYTSLTFLPHDLHFKSKIDVDIFGKTNLDDLRIRSKVNFTDLQAYGENSNSGSFDISLFNRVLSISNFDANLSSGNINGNFIFGLKDETLKFKYNWENLEFSQFNFAKRVGLGFNSTLSGKMSGAGSLKDYVINLEATAFNTKASSYVFEDSSVDLLITPQRIKGRTNIFGKIIKSDFNLGLTSGLASDLKLDVNSPDIKPFLVALFGQQLESEEFSGDLDLSLDTSFKNGFNDLDLTATVKSLNLRHAEFNVNYSSLTPQFIVRNSQIQKWDMGLREKDLYATSKGVGVFGRKISLVHELHFNTKILEILLPQVLSAEGFARNIIRIDGNGTNFDFSISSKATDLDLSIDQVPVNINDLQYDIEYAAKQLRFRQLKASLDTGSISFQGDIFMDDNYPDVNLKFNLDKAEIPILGKSFLNVTGEGIILGNSPPYHINGELLLNKVQVINELTEFSSKSTAFSNVRFLPKNQESALSKMFTLNMNVKIENPARITNSLMDVALKGEVRLLGNPSRLKGEGRLTSPVNSSRIFFKNNEYLITSADINFNPKKDLLNPDFDVQALTMISNYKVFPKAYGDLERFNFELTSEPTLPRNSILSLIAFGYTNEIQSSLQSKDQQSLTNVGVGSFVFDRFKISDILNKQFGLQVNLGTVIEQSSTDSLLTGRSQEGQFGQGGGAVGRTRSATKIELKKRLDEALTLSVSSTMGGSIGQRQSMNLNYGISKNIQLEGVYELKTNQFGQEDIIYNSIGGDIKFRGTFE